MSNRRSAVPVGKRRSSPSDRPGSATRDVSGNSFFRCLSMKQIRTLTLILWAPTLILSDAAQGAWPFISFGAVAVSENHCYLGWNQDIYVVDVSKVLPKSELVIYPWSCAARSCSSIGVRHDGP